MGTAEAIDLASVSSGSADCIGGTPEKLAAELSASFGAPPAAGPQFAAQEGMDMFRSAKNASSSSGGAGQDRDAPDQCPDTSGPE